MAIENQYTNKILISTNYYFTYNQQHPFINKNFRHKSQNPCSSTSSELDLPDPTVNLNHQGTTHIHTHTLTDEQ